MTDYYFFKRTSFFYKSFERVLKFCKLWLFCYLRVINIFNLGVHIFLFRYLLSSGHFLRDSTNVTLIPTDLFLQLPFSHIFVSSVVIN